MRIIINPIVNLICQGLGCWVTLGALENMSVWGLSYETFIVINYNV